MTGGSIGRHRITSAATVAYDAATGAERWVQRCCGAVGGYGRDLEATGSRLVMLASAGRDIQVVSYDQATGAPVWSASFRRGWYQAADDLEVGGGGVFVVGQLTREDRGWSDYLVLALDEATGDRRWLRTYDGDAFFPDGRATSGSLSPNGATLFVTGTVTSRRNTSVMTTTIAYDAATGDRRWTSRLVTRHRMDDRNPLVEAAADGSGVTVVTMRADVDVNVSLITAEYGPARGRERWIRREPIGGEGAHMFDLALSADGTRAYVAGMGSLTVGAPAGWLALAYDTGVGGPPTWVRSAPPSVGADSVFGAAVVPDGSFVILAGDLNDALVTEGIAGP